VVDCRLVNVTSEGRRRRRGRGSRGRNTLKMEEQLPKGTVRILEATAALKPLQKQASTTTIRAPINVVKYTHDGTYLMSGGADKSPRLWNPNTGMCIKTYSGGHGWDVLDLAISFDKAHFASCDASPNSTQPSLLIWDIGTAQILKRLSGGHQGRINAVSFHEPDCHIVFTGGYDSTVRCWDLRQQGNIGKAPIMTMKEAKDAITSIATHDAEICTGSVDGHLRIYDVRTGDLIEDCVGHPITSLCYSKDGQTLLVGSTDNRVRLFDRSNGEVLNSYAGHVHQDYNVKSCFSPMESMCISGSEDGQMFVWDIVQGGKPSEFRHSEGGRLDDAYKKRAAVTCVAAAPKTVPMQLCSAGQDGVIKIWQ
jgi:mitogen-activated protein kinase organizer 1